MSSISELISMNKSLLAMEAVDVNGDKMVSLSKVNAIFDTILSEFSSSDFDKLFGDEFEDMSNIELPWSDDSSKGISAINDDTTVKVDTVSSSGKWVGNVGDMVSLDLKYVSSEGPISGNFGDYYIYTFDYQGNKVTWLTGLNKFFIKGNIYKTVCEIKNHTEFNNERITRVKGCKFQEPLYR